MANRSYLYSINEIPTQKKDKITTRIRGLSEWDYDVPLSYKLLISTNPKVVKSIIWDVDDDAAIIADYAVGLQKMKDLKNKITDDKTISLIQESIQYLENDNNIGKYLFLEIGELLQMVDSPIQTQMKLFFKEISNIQLEINEFIDYANNINTPKKSLLSKVLKKKDPYENILKYGFGYWTDILYYDLNQE